MLVPPKNTAANPYQLQPAWLNRSCGSWPKDVAMIMGCTKMVSNVSDTDNATNNTLMDSSLRLDKHLTVRANTLTTTDTTTEKIILKNTSNTLVLK